MVVLAGAEVRKPPAAELSAALFGTPEEAREMEVAAVHIQAAFRGYQSRHNHDSYRDARRRKRLRASCKPPIRRAVTRSKAGNIEIVLDGERQASEAAAGRACSIAFWNGIE